MTRRSFRALYEVLSRGPDDASPVISNARSYALAYIGVFEGAKAIPYVLPFVRDRNWALYGIAALGTIDDGESRRVLREILEQSPNEGVWRAAVQSIGRLEDQEAIPALVRLSKEEHLEPWTRLALVQAFIAIDPFKTLDDELRLIREIESDQPSGERSALELRGAAFQRLKPQLDTFNASDNGPMRTRLLSAVFKISGWTSLMQSAQHGQVEAVRELIDGGADVNAKNVFGGTALTLAAEAGAHETVQMLLRSGARFQWEGVTALMEASRNGHVEIVKTLLHHGACVHSKSSGIEWTALMHAADQGHADIVRLLLKKEARVNVASANGGLTPLILASWQGDHETTELLLKAGARVSDKTDGFYWEQDALLFASWGGSATVVELLLKAGAEIDVTNRNGRTPLMLAAESGETEVVRVLLQNGAEVSIQDRLHQTALSIALANQHFAVATLLRLITLNITSAASRPFVGRVVVLNKPYLDSSV